MALLTYSFTTSTVDTLPPYVDSQNPMPNAVGVLVTSPVYVKVLDDVDGSGVLIKSIRIRFNGLLAYDGGLPAVEEDTPATYNNGFVEGFAVSSTLTKVEFVPPPLGPYYPNIGQGFEFYLVPDGGLNDGTIYPVSVLCDDRAANRLLWEYSFTTEDISSPEVVRQDPLPGRLDAPKDTDIKFSVTDNIGVNIKTLAATIQGVPAYDGTVSEVIAGTPSTWVLGFRAGFMGTRSAIVANTDHGFDVTIDPETDFSLFEVVAVVVDADDTGLNHRHAAYTFNVSAPGNVQKIKMYGQIVGYSQVEFIRTGTSTKDFTTFASGLQIEPGPTEYIEVGVRPGQDVLVDQAYDLNVKVGPLEYKLVYNGTTKGVRFNS